MVKPGNGLLYIKGQQFVAAAARRIICQFLADLVEFVGKLLEKDKFAKVVGKAGEIGLVRGREIKMLSQGLGGGGNADGVQPEINELRLVRRDFCLKGVKNRDRENNAAHGIEAGR
jgi:hypothetical protein